MTVTGEYLCDRTYETKLHSVMEYASLIRNLSPSSIFEISKHGNNIFFEGGAKSFSKIFVVCRIKLSNYYL